MGSSRNANWEGAGERRRKEDRLFVARMECWALFFLLPSTALIHLSNNYQTPPKVQLAQV